MLDWNATGVLLLSEKETELGHRVTVLAAGGGLFGFWGSFWHSKAQELNEDEGDESDHDGAGDGETDNEAHV